MKKREILLAILLVTIWGVNFTVIKLGLIGIPSMLLVALRYTLTFFPAIFFIKKPKTKLKYIILYGLFVGVGQFSCLFYAMEIGMPAGIASIVLQIQAFISPIFAMLFLKEKLKTKQVIGFIVSALGLVLIASAEGINMDKVPPLAYLLMIAALTFWAASNIVARIASDEAANNDYCCPNPSPSTYSCPFVCKNSSLRATVSYAMVRVHSYSVRSNYSKY